MLVAIWPVRCSGPILMELHTLMWGANYCLCRACRHGGLLVMHSRHARSLSSPAIVCARSRASLMMMCPTLQPRRRKRYAVEAPPPLWPALPQSPP